MVEKDVLDIFSFEKQVSTEYLTQIFKTSRPGIETDGYSVHYEIPDNASDNVVACTEDLHQEGRLVAYMIKDNAIVAVIGYKELQV